MTTVSALLLIITFLLTIGGVGYLVHEVTNDKPANIGPILLICGALVTSFLGGSNNHNKVQAVDLPEEYQQLSHNSAKPDTVLAFYDNDTVYIQFKH